MGGGCQFKINVSSDPGTTNVRQLALEHEFKSDPQSQENFSQVAEIVTTSNELGLLYSLMFSELLTGTSPVVSKSSAIHAADNPNKRQQHNSIYSSTTIDVADPPPLNIQSVHINSNFKSKLSLHLRTLFKQNSIPKMHICCAEFITF
ncbi:hypothetical protein Tco_0653802 [Tanacetum coccineum]|uniref:Uncharacterized protein n=1 Tax=Tanacetum coccineum TaxID=301880 RepID=A0ABQ4X1V0_9ASTR